MSTPKKVDLLKEAKRLGLMGAESWDYQLLRRTVAAYLKIEGRQAK